MKRQHSNNRNQHGPVFRPPLSQIMKSKNGNDSEVSPSDLRLGLNEVSHQDDGAANSYTPPTPPAPHADKQISLISKERTMTTGTPPNRFKLLLWGMSLGLLAIFLFNYSQISMHEAFPPLTAALHPRQMTNTQLNSDIKSGDRDAGEVVSLDQEETSLKHSVIDTPNQAVGAGTREVASSDGVSEDTFEYTGQSKNEVHSSTLGLIVDALSDL